MTEQIAQRLVDIAFKVSFEGDFTDLRKHLELQGYKIRIDHEGTKFATMSADGRIATAFMAYSDPITVLSGMLIALWGPFAFRTNESKVAFELLNKQWTERKKEWQAVLKPEMNWRCA